jgi:hypothetical protein
MNRLDQFLTELRKDFGKFTRCQLLCEEQDASTEAAQISLAEQVLAEPPVGSVAAGHANWAKLHGARSKPAPPYKPTGF